jgi:ABC-type nitrate/sulfonate/bicarbonate transport system ATPase subunit
MNDTELTVNILSMSYPKAVANGPLIEKVSFSVQPRSTIAFVGRSGAGKTTLLRMIAGLERRFSGDIRLGGIPITKPSRDIQIVFQDYRLLPWKTVGDNIRFAVSGDDGSEVERWLEIIGMKDKRDAWPKTLSGGEEGRVALARTFVSPPKVLLLDEPFRNLDLVAKFNLQAELIRNLERQRAIVILISHSIDDAVLLSDTVYLLSRSPMRIQARFDVNVEKPRKRGDPKLIELAAKIQDSLMKLERT